MVKRDGRLEAVSLDKVVRRVRAVSDGLRGTAPEEVARRVTARLHDGVSTCDLDDLAANMCGSMALEHADYGVLASRLATSAHHRRTPDSFAGAVGALWGNTGAGGAAEPLVSSELKAIVDAHAGELEAAIDYGRDYDFDFFGFKTLERSYLLRLRGGRVVERPQHLFMRVALGIHGWDLGAAVETYQLMATKHCVHATPTLFNAGTPRPQLSSCFLLQLREDSVEGIFDTLKDCARISKYAGGIGLHVGGARAKGSAIRGTAGTAYGLPPMLRVFNNTARYVNQSSRRNGSIAVYVEPWHPDILSFLELKKPHGAEEERARDLFYGLWVPDLFMRRVREGGLWSLMCPDACPDLAEAHGPAFDALYAEHEAAGRYVRRLPAQELWFKIVEAQIETGTPYVLFKDAANAKSNQQNLGTIKCSNLCTEVVQRSSPDEIAVCNLASICLPAFVRGAADEGETPPRFDFARLVEVAGVVTRNLNRVIDRTFYPHELAAASNARHRPIGIGVQGLADAYALMGLPFDSEGARALNRDVFAGIYYGAMRASVALAREAGAYASFAGSPLSAGRFQFDLWGVAPSPAYDWDALRAEVRAHGARNSLLVAPMPTASTSQIMGCTECFEPFTSNLYKRKTLAGEHIVVNRLLVARLEGLGLWDAEMRDSIVRAQGSVQGIERIPPEVRALFRTAWDVSMRAVIDQAADRAPYVCQSMSMSLFMADPDYQKVTSMLFYAWEKGLKTGMYYLRTKTKARAQQFTVRPAPPPGSARDEGAAEAEGGACGRGGVCEACTA